MSLRSTGFGALVSFAFLSACTGGIVVAPPPPSGATCGNGTLDAGEACDDGNTQAGDGCSSDCTQVETGYRCPTPGSSCILGPPPTAVCGNGVVEDGEACDDHNTQGGDGCTADCSAIESGWTCPTAGAACTRTPAQAVCGNGAVESGEACDDHNTQGGDGCAADCKTVEGGWTCPAQGGACTRLSVCGNGVIEGSEGCDDGNTRSGDGCSGDCTHVETGFTCPVVGERCLETAACGNGHLDPGESCDDGGHVDGDGCAADCTRVDPGYACPHPGSSCVLLDSCGNGIVDPGEACDEAGASVGCALDCSAVTPGYACPDPGSPCVLIDTCGNGMLDPGEACDDGGTASGDGCAADCSAVESGYVCPVPGEACVHPGVCGNGIRDAGEACDDGNQTSGDGCAADCKAIEAGWICPTAGEACQVEDWCGNGVVEAGEVCDDGNRWGGDGCAADCKSVEGGFQCPPLGGACVPENTCGNGILDGGEDCDDHNTWGEDGCSASCTVERNWECPTPGQACNLLCGNGRIDTQNVDVAEACDDGNRRAGDGCSASCTVERNWECPTGTACNLLCGNGRIDTENVDVAEACDDGNHSDGDGCSASCTVERNWECPTPGAACNLLCGNGRLDTVNVDVPEQCDDGNVAGGDGCTALCTVERNWECPTPGAACNLLCGNGRIDTVNVDVAETCDDGNRSGGDGCSGTCSVERNWECPTPGAACNKLCGNGRVDTVNVDVPEQCDDPAGNTGGYGRCKSDCTWDIRCGDGIRNGPEQCEGECANGVACSNVGDACADGSTCTARRDGGYNGCKSDCTLDIHCGDGIRNGPEQCEGECANGVACSSVGDACGDGSTCAARRDGGYNGCKADCTLDMHCGDGILNGAEQCEGECPNGKACLNVGDACTGGGTCAAVRSGNYGGCTATCQRAPFCGDAVRQDPPEECDDGLNDDTYGTCNGDCTRADYCGDGKLNTSYESCDYGDTCGDGSPCPTDGSKCAVGTCNDGTYGGCRPNCRWAPYCGDRQITPPETCDDGPSCVDGTRCTKDADCAAVSDPDKTCKPRGGDGCAANCLLETGWKCPTPGQACELTCGNGKPDAGEACDDGNIEGGDGCSANCQAIEPGYACTFGQPCTFLCGNGVVDDGEDCDDGNAVSGDGCTGFTGASDWVDGCKVEVDWECPTGTSCNRLCGNGRTDAAGVTVPEQCDAGGRCSISNESCSVGTACPTGAGACVSQNTGAYGGCNSNCTKAGYCGDGIKNGTEQCDVATCADGVTLCTNVGGPCPGNGTCTAHNTGAYDGCRANCTSGPHCGDGLVTDGETCDEGANPPSGGCSTSCHVNTGWVCKTPGQPCVPDTCGVHNQKRCSDLATNCAQDSDCAGMSGTDKTCRARLDPGEACDDGMWCSDGLTPCSAPIACTGIGDGKCLPRDGDGCNAACSAIEPGWDCSAVGQHCVAARCGDGIVAGWETCDDGNTKAGDGCTSTCQLEQGYKCPNEGQPCVAITCGDGVKEGLEQCDDHNTNNTDGCSYPGCQIQPGYSCPTVGQPCVAITTTCGDGVLVPGEQCDDHNKIAGDGCSATCQIESGWVCPTANAACQRLGVTCGDGKKEPGEECDDGKSCYRVPNGKTTAACTSDADCANVGCLASDVGCDRTCQARGGDGCDAFCRIEKIFACDPTGNCKPLCGDGITLTAAGEECDDGNTVSGDGCSASCKKEPGFTCTAFPVQPPPTIDLSVKIRDFKGWNENLTGTGVTDGYWWKDTGGCVGGPTPGRPCTQDGDCGGGGQCGFGVCTAGTNPGAPCVTTTATVCTTCTAGRCVGGTRNGNNCYVNSTCTGGACWPRQPPITGDAPALAMQCPSAGSKVCNGHPDFESYQCGSETTGLVSSMLGADKTPVYAGGTSPSYGTGGCGFTSSPTHYQITSDATFNQWYHDTPNVNRTVTKTLRLVQTGTNTYEFNSRYRDYATGACCDPTRCDPTTYPCDEDGKTPTPACPCAGFFPIDNELYGNSGNDWQPTPVAHNFGFTSEFHAYFKYQGGETLTFSGDDDVWVYINDKLALDLGGLHPRTQSSVTLSSSKTMCGSAVSCTVNGDSDCPNGNICCRAGMTGCTVGQCASPVVRDCTLDLMQGGIYEIAMFHAERHTNASNYWLTLTGFVNTGTATCTATCGDGEIVGNEQCDDGGRCGNGADCTVGGTPCKDGTTCAPNTTVGLCGDGATQCTVGGSACPVGTCNPTCSATCQLTPYCGDGAVKYPEQCDPPSAAANCSPTCRFITCGNGAKEGHEECDAGAGNGGMNACTTQCLNPMCGDGFVDRTGEDCDPGGRCADGTACVVVDNNVWDNCRDGSSCAPRRDDPTCTKDCKRPYCGDGIQSPGEACDDGALNGQYQKCLTDCSGYGGDCGDGIINGPEECDDGTAQNTGGYGRCKSDCKLDIRCGDGIEQQADGEECDRGVAGNDGVACTTDCKLPRVCGDAIPNPATEQCDFGTAGNTGVWARDYCESCTGLCSCGPWCGDGRTDRPYEECDRGTTQNTGGYDGCKFDCTLDARCGDGLPNGTEQCDLGGKCSISGEACAVGSSCPAGAGTCVSLNTGAYGGCNSDCTWAPRCGDGIRNGTEQCEGECADGKACQNVGDLCADGSPCAAQRTGNYGGCNPDCSFAPACGDFIVQTADGETCDDGADNNKGLYGGCKSDCTLAPRCGDKNTDAPAETCDYGGRCSVSGAECTVGTACPAGAGTCVSQNTGAYGGCRSNCTWASHCGDGVLNIGNEACDGTALGGRSCQDLGFTAGVLKCDATCQLDTSGCYSYFCGDGIKNGDESCDGSDLGNQTCELLGYPSGGGPGLACKPDCTYDVSGCAATCGNDRIDPGEECDGAAEIPQTCEGLGLGYTGGTLACKTDCTLDRSGCEYCGDGKKNGNEACDGQDFGPATCESEGYMAGQGQLSCAPDCMSIDTSGCYQCKSCSDCDQTQGCVDHRCGPCNSDADCCQPNICVLGRCTSY